MQSTLEKVNPIKAAWDRLHHVFLGKKAFNFLIARMVPYTGSIHAQVEELRLGFCKVTMKDQRKVRNHLGCVHAIALANMAELCGNLAVIYSLPDDARFIVSEIHMSYLKKARGFLTATTHAPIVESNEKKTYDVSVEIKDASGEVCCTASLKTLVGSKK